MTDVTQSNDDISLTSQMVAGMVRHLLTVAGGGLVSAGYMTGNDFADLVGAIATIAGVAWSLYHKWQMKKALTAASVTSAQKGAA